MYYAKSMLLKKPDCILTDFSEFNKLYSEDIYGDAVYSKVMKVFDEYVNTKSGINKDVLLAWYGSNFEGTVVTVATICNTSPSYVSRVLCSFRAYLAGKLKELCFFLF